MGLTILSLEFLDDLPHRQNAVYAAHALAGAPDIPPGLAAGGAKIAVLGPGRGQVVGIQPGRRNAGLQIIARDRSEEHTSELQSLMRSSYAVFCLKKKKITHDRRE